MEKLNKSKEGVRVTNGEKIERILKSNVPFGAKLLAVDIAFMDSCYTFSNDEIAERTGAGRSSVARWLNDLKDAGLIASTIYKGKRKLIFN